MLWWKNNPYTKHYKSSSFLLDVLLNISRFVFVSVICIKMYVYVALGPNKPRIYSTLLSINRRPNQGTKVTTDREIIQEQLLNYQGTEYHPKSCFRVAPSANKPKPKIITVFIIHSIHNRKIEQNIKTDQQINSFDFPPQWEEFSGELQRGMKHPKLTDLTLQK